MMRVKPPVLATAVFVFPVVVSVLGCVMVWRSEGYGDSPIPFVVAFFIMVVILINGIIHAVDNPTVPSLALALSPFASTEGVRDAEAAMQEALDRKAWINNLGFIAPVILVIQQLLIRM
ncbi:hypothetical protein [Kocuria rosea]|uniref:hypothetical protein n=1 Tax=Kocuria rosea TaxID=1275 RepID=UPI0011A8AFEE|nr:hypothetical protein [Kocuria rosea]